MRYLLLLFICLLVLASGSHAQMPEQFYGKLTGLQADTVHMYQRVLSVPSAATKYRFEPQIEAGATISEGKLIDGRSSDELEVLLVEPPNRLPYLAVDLN